MVKTSVSADLEIENPVNRKVHLLTVYAMRFYTPPFFDGEHWESGQDELSNFDFYLDGEGKSEKDLITAFGPEHVELMISNIEKCISFL